jgi:hypothetical protein
LRAVAAGVVECSARQATEGSMAMGKRPQVTVVRRAPALLGAIALALVGALVGTDAAAGKVLADQDQPMLADGAGGRLVWSRFDATRRRFTLMSTEAGRTRALPVRPRKVAFDVSLGDDRRGRAVAVYSRCRDDRYPVLYRWSHGCRLYEYRFDTRREQRLDVAMPPGMTSTYLPAISHGQVAFAARSDDHSMAIYLTGTGRRSAAVPILRPDGDDPLVGTRNGDAEGVTRLDLLDGALAYSWNYQGQRATCGAPNGSDTMIVVREAGGAQRMVAHGGCDTDDNGGVEQAQWSGPGALRYLAWAPGGLFDVSLRLVDLAGGATRTWTDHREIETYAVDGRGHALGQILGTVQTMPVLPAA